MSNFKKSIFILPLLLFCSTIYAQIVLHGSVVDKDKRIGVDQATIAESANYVRSDTSGTFALTVKELPVMLTVSHLAFKSTSLLVQDDSFITIELDPLENAIEEIPIYTGYQQIPKERATGSFETIGESSLARLNSPNILERLEGNSSLLFDKHANRPAITLRGLSTIHGAKNPLIILDNFPFDGDLANINPNDVESITLLKDAAASSIWGVRAGNGVIVITTKKGMGRAGSTLSLSSSLQVQTKPNLRNYKYISSADLIGLERELFERGHYRSQEQSAGKMYLSPVVISLIKHRDGMMNETELNTVLDGLSQIDNRKQFMDNYYTAGIDQQYSLNHTWTKPGISMASSVSYHNGNNVLENKVQRITFRSNGIYDLGAKWKLATSLMYSDNNTTQGKESFESYTSLRHYINLWDEHGNDIPLPSYNEFYLHSISDKGLLDWNRYLASEHKHTDQGISDRTFYANIDLGYDLGYGVKLDLMYNPSLRMGKNKREYGVHSFYARNLINRYTSINEQGELAYNIPYGGILDEIDTEEHVQNVRGQLAYSKSFGDHEVNFIGGAEFRMRKSLSKSSREYGFDPSVLLTTAVNYNLPYRDFVTGATIYIPYNGGYGELNENNISQYFNGTYSYRGRYVLSGSLRRDASNIFGLKTNEKWNPLWSLGFSWDLARENFMTVLPVFSTLKAKITYGKSGLINPSSTAITVLDYRTASVTNFLSAALRQFPNPELRWEKSSMLNIGLDFGLFENRLYGNIIYFKKWGSDLFGPAPMDLSAGVGASLTRNVANMTGEGFDIDFNMQWLRDRLFKWRTRILFSTNNSRVTDYFNTASASYQVLSQGGAVNPIVGKPLYSIIAYPFVGLDENGDPLSMLDGEETIDYGAVRTAPYDNLIYAGPSIPTLHGTISNHFHYKNFELDINLIYKMGHYVMSPLLSYPNLIGMINHNGSGFYTDRWLNPGDEKHTSVPAFRYPLNSYREQVYGASTAGVSKASHIRLHYVRLGYSLTPRHLKKVSVFGIAQNLGILWKKDSSLKDPEYPNGPAPNKQYSIGFSLNF